MRLWYWDNAYTSAGVARSEKDERTRKYLREYVDDCELFEADSQEEEVFYDMVVQEDTSELFREFVQSLKNPTLMPVQESRRNELERIAEMNMWKGDRASNGDEQTDYEIANRQLIYTLLDARDW